MGDADTSAASQWERLTHSNFPFREENTGGITDIYLPEATVLKQVADICSDSVQREHPD